jgi:hypothetical protein
MHGEHLSVLLFFDVMYSFGYGYLSAWNELDMIKVFEYAYALEEALGR